MKLIAHLSIIAAVLISASCEEQLELLPPNQLVQEEYWKTQEDVKATLMGAYKQFAEQDNYLFYYGELRGDMLQQGDNLNNSLRDIMEGNIYPDNNWTNYNNFYSIVNYCNLVLKYSPQVKAADKTFSTFDYNSFQAEAVFLRSLAYFYLVRTFKDVPFVLTPYDNSSQDFFLKKTKDNIILDSLEVQLQRVINKIPENHKTQSETRGRATRGAVYALLADIALWKFDYEGSLSYLNKIQQSSLYRLLPASQWFTIFSNGNTYESIFEFQYDGVNLENHMFDITKDNQGRLNFMASPYAISIISPSGKSEQYRGSGSISPTDQMIWKYIGAQPGGLQRRSGTDQKSCNWVVYRLADIYLMKAEALSQMERYGEALALVDTIRTRANAEPVRSVNENPQAFEDLILEERAKEFAFEGKRWFDLLRMGRRNNYKRKERLIEIIIEGVPATQKRVLAAKLSDPNGWYLPINSREIENNANLVQNSYYQEYGN